MIFFLKELERAKYLSVPAVGDPPLQVQQQRRRRPFCSLALLLNCIVLPLQACPLHRRPPPPLLLPHLHQPRRRGIEAGGSGPTERDSFLLKRLQNIFLAKTVANLVASLAKGEEGDPGGAAVRNRAAAVAKAAVDRSSRRSFLRGRDRR